MKRLTTLAALAVLVSGCGEHSNGTAQAPAAGEGTQTTSSCTLRQRQDWALQQLSDWYLFPETLPAALDPAGFDSVGAYVDALTATARGQRRDRYFTYVTSIAEEEAFYRSGASAGFGIRLTIDGPARRVFVIEAFEGAPGIAAGLDRGTEILAIGAPGEPLRPVAEIIAVEGNGGVTAALGPSTAGTARTLRIADAAGTREVTVAKADFAIPPVSPRYGIRIIDDGGRRVGYINLRTFISTADDPLRAATAQLRAAGITEVIVDLRYNGGGLVSTAELLGDLLGGARSRNEVQSHTVFRASKASENRTRTYEPRSQSIAPTRIAFIGTEGTASASELVINATRPYLRGNAALVGSNTYGKPVGQIARDREECDDRLRVVAFATQNAARQGDYFEGLAPVMESTCQAADDPGFALGDPREASTRAALDFLAGRGCTPIAGGQTTQATGGRGRLRLLTPDQPSAAQREVPGLF